MSNPELAAWLCEQRQRRAWSRLELARRLIKTARDNGDISVPSAENVAHNIYRWERGTVGPAERYKLYYCRVFGIPARKFGPDRAVKPAYPGPAVPAIPATAVVKFTAGVLGLWQEFLSEVLTVHGPDEAASCEISAMRKGVNDANRPVPEAAGRPRQTPARARGMGHE